MRVAVDVARLLRRFSHLLSFLTVVATKRVQVDLRAAHRWLQEKRMFARFNNRVTGILGLLLTRS